MRSIGVAFCGNVNFLSVNTPVENRNRNARQTLYLQIPARAVFPLSSVFVSASLAATAHSSASFVIFSTNVFSSPTILISRLL